MNNISIKCIKSYKIKSGACYGQFVINSLKTGQGITIGNQLRRVLLGDLGGIAISAVRIAGVTHEFSTIPGIVIKRHGKVMVICSNPKHKQRQG